VDRRIHIRRYMTAVSLRARELQRRCCIKVAALDAQIELVVSRLNVLEAEAGAKGGCELGAG
jgi:hypothetical protein